MRQRVTVRARTFARWTRRRRRYKNVVVDSRAWCDFAGTQTHLQVTRDLERLTLYMFRVDSPAGLCSVVGVLEQ